MDVSVSFHLKQWLPDLPTTLLIYTMVSRSSNRSINLQMYPYFTNKFLCFQPCLPIYIRWIPFTQWYFSFYRSLVFHTDHSANLQWSILHFTLVNHPIFHTSVSFTTDGFRIQTGWFSNLHWSVFQFTPIRLIIYKGWSSHQHWSMVRLKRVTLSVGEAATVSSVGKSEGKVERQKLSENLVARVGLPTYSSTVSQTNPHSLSNFKNREDPEDVLSIKSFSLFHL